ncbi:hypothetical protein [Mammaliicoccus sp. Dog046]|uniref:DUF7147 family protein n=1 Tax=Mammaliicoccus sp. Dog046 TaxID=3034233 RepID=UPI002B26226A|nr:hypothetical protein [Mammaliicoccus sp. Dog046]WQK84676.1 hypothetical protein P3U32_08530 [Mammaliicoccus sp. Dog046]
MKQSFIVIGHGLTDLFEFQTIIEYNHARISDILMLHTPLSKDKLSSACIIMKPTEGRHFQAIYTILEGIKYPYPEANKKFDLIQSWAEAYDIQVKGLDVKSRSEFAEDDLYFTYLKGVLRLEHYLPPLQ